MYVESVPLQGTNDDEVTQSQRPLPAAGAGGGDPHAAHHSLAQRRLHALREKRQADPRYLNLDKSLGLFGYYHPLRAALRAVLSNPWFDRGILVLILINCVQLALYDSRYDALGIADDIVDATLNSLFLLEMLVKIVANGFLLTREAYLKDGWNCLDFVTVAAGVINWFTPTNNSLTALRAFRVLRPLRAISRIRKLKVIIGAFLRSLPSLADAAILYAFLLVVFGVTGVNLWKSELRQRCVNPSLGLLSDRNCDPLTEFGYSCPWNYTCAIADPATGRLFPNPLDGKVGFDHVGDAALTLWVSITQEGWTDVMYMTIDASGWVWVWYWVGVILLGSFFLTNLFVVIINRAFAQSRDTQRQVEEIERMRELHFGRKNLPGHALLAFATDAAGDDDEDADGRTRAPKGFRRPFWKLVHSKYFSAAVVVLILVNIAIMSTDHVGQDRGFEKGMDAANAVCTVLFAAELVVKVVALTPRGYAASGWNLFDAFIVAMSLLDLLAAFGSRLAVLRTLRLLRVFRVLRVFGLLESLRMIIETVVRSIQDTALVTLLLALVLFIFACLGVQIFGNTFWPPPRGRLEERPRSHFDYFFPAAVTVFQVMTGENWNTVMYTAMRAVGAFSSVYFITLFIISNYVVLNLFVAVLLAAFEDSAGHEEEEAAFSLARLGPPYGVSAPPTELKEAAQLAFGAPAAPAAAPEEDIMYVPEQYLLEWEEAFDLRKIVRKPNSLRDRRQPVDIRQKAQRLVLSGPFRGLVLLLILLSTAALILENPLHAPDVPLRVFCDRVNLVLTLCFAAEMLLKVYALRLFDNPEWRDFLAWKHTLSKLKEGGARFDALGDDDDDDDDQTEGEEDEAARVERKRRRRLEKAAEELPTPYFLDPFNVADAVIVLLSVGSLLPRLERLAFFRIARSLRPLRLLNRSRGMRQVMYALLQSFGQLIYVVLLCFLVWLLFAILGVEFFKGAFGVCIAGDAPLDQTQFPFPITRGLCETRGNRTVLADGSAWIADRTLYYRTGNATAELVEEVIEWPQRTEPHAAVTQPGTGSTPATTVADEAEEVWDE